MKSIKEWMFEKGLLGEDFDKNAMSRYFGSTTVEVDQGLRRELKPKIERIMDMDEYKSVPKDDMLNKLKVVISQVVADLGGSRFTSRGLADRLSDDQNMVDKSKFSRMMGSEALEVDLRLRQELKPKLERIMDMEEYRDIPKSELEEKLIAVVSQLVGEMSGSTMSVSTLANRMDSFEDEPIAKEESAKMPSFLRWIENSEEGDSTSEPQHKQGEENMDLKGVVEKRMMQIAMELESDGKGSRQEVLAAMKAVVDSAGKESEQGNEQQQEDPNAQQGGHPQMGNEAPPQQPPQQMQPQVQS